MRKGTNLSLLDRMEEIEEEQDISNSNLREMQSGAGLGNEDDDMVLFGALPSADDDEEAYDDDLYQGPVGSYDRAILHDSEDDDDLMDDDGDHIIGAINEDEEEDEDEDSLADDDFLVRDDVPAPPVLRQTTATSVGHVSSSALIMEDSFSHLNPLYEGPEEEIVVQTLLPRSQPSSPSAAEPAFPMHEVAMGPPTTFRKAKPNYYKPSMMAPPVAKTVLAPHVSGHGMADDFIGDGLFFSGAGGRITNTPNVNASTSDAARTGDISPISPPVMIPTSKQGDYPDDDDDDDWEGTGHDEERAQDGGKSDLDISSDGGGYGGVGLHSPPISHRSSFTSNANLTRRSSSSITAVTIASAPPDFQYGSHTTGLLTPTALDGGSHRRRVTIHDKPPGSGSASSYDGLTDGSGDAGGGSDPNHHHHRLTMHRGFNSRRRQNLVYRGRSDLAMPNDSNVGFMSGKDVSSPSGGAGSALNRARSVFTGRRSAERHNSTQAQSVRSGASSLGSQHKHTKETLGMIQAAERLTAGTGAESGSVAAAAAIVTASTNAATNRGYVQFSQGDHVLALLRILNYTLPPDFDKDLCTIDPVNKSGFTPAEGHSELQKQGPFSYVLCVVEKVHFDEDARYYTVRRADTGTEQRADPFWMEPLTDAAGMEAALRAAQRTKRSMAEHTAPAVERKKMHLVAGPARWARNTLLPWLAQRRTHAKVFLVHFLHGHGGYAFRVHLTGINFLVLCSFTYLFIEVITLAFLSPSVDQAAAIIGLVVWIVLVLELVLECLIRPADYYLLNQSDKAFAPSTARHINTCHMICEALALLLYVPRISCVTGQPCGTHIVMLDMTSASVNAINSLQNWKAALSRFTLGLSFLKAFGLVRHWKQMWINHTFEGSKAERLFMHKVLMVERDRPKPLQRLLNRKKQKAEDDADTTMEGDLDPQSTKQQSNDDDQQLKNAATIGTALMLVNSHRALFLLLCIVTIFPAIYSLGSQNRLPANDVLLLNGNNVAAQDDCEYLRIAVESWLNTTAYNIGVGASSGDMFVFLLWAQILPVRCPWQRGDGVITVCPNGTVQSAAICDMWDLARHTFPDLTTPEYVASQLDLRPGGLVVHERSYADSANGQSVVFFAKAIFNESHSVSQINLSLFLLLVCMLALTLIGLTVMRNDAGRLVLDPLQRMLKIVVRYAENPLSHTASKGSKGRTGSVDPSKEDRVNHGFDEDETNEQLGHYETEQLINAISKIADLLRKCWGVAGAGIISSNLARTKDGRTVVFNPTVPGKRVYALFGFVAINDFSKLLRVLDREVMILINDVAKVVHDEVYRWSLGDSGQCNKNLGSAFLMVFRIGDFSEVHDKKKRATDVVFNSQMRKNIKVKQRKNSAGAKKRGASRNFDIGNDGTLQLASLPGIQSFTDRALLGLLKSFAGLHRDRSLMNWQKDFRLGAGVGAFTVNVIYGMDAGWAVEGAVGSEYKIDATYLSPHVNMASRMMSACKQYGVTILLSQAVEELLSKPARLKLRHLDTVYVKGSSVEQRIYTYDARYEGVDFFLFDRTPDQADLEADNYNPSIWETDQDLRSMRQHVTDEFMTKFSQGIEEYIEGKWKQAIKSLQDADDIMLRAVLEDGYVDYKCDIDPMSVFDRKATGDEINRIRNEFGDGASKCLIHYMQRRHGVAPVDWRGVRHLMSK